MLVLRRRCRIRASRGVLRWWHSLNLHLRVVGDSVRSSRALMHTTGVLGRDTALDRALVCSLDHCVRG